MPYNCKNKFIKKFTKLQNSLFNFTNYKLVNKVIVNSKTVNLKKVQILKL
jgi:hypothetical protein